MEKRVSNTTSSGGPLADFELEGFLRETDIFRSGLLYDLTTDRSIPRTNYLVGTDYLYRPDLVAKDFYGDVRYESFVILQAGSIKNIVPGRVLELVGKETLRRLGNG